MPSPPTSEKARERERERTQGCSSQSEEGKGKGPAEAEAEAAEGRRGFREKEGLRMVAGCGARRRGLAGGGGVGVWEGSVPIFPFFFSFPFFYRSFLGDKNRRGGRERESGLVG